MWRALQRLWLRPPTPQTTLWRGRPLPLRRLHVGALSEAHALPNALDDLTFAPDTRVLILDPDGLRPPWLPERVDAFTLLLSSRDDLILAARTAARHGAFDLLILPLLAAGPADLHLAEALAHTAAHAPPTAWVVWTIGSGAPELRRGLRVAGVRLGV